VRTDSLFYRIFSAAPQVLFQLIGQYRTLLTSSQVQICYLDELRNRPNLPVSLGVLQLVVEPAQTTPDRARQLLQQAQEQLSDPLTTVIIELVTTTLVYKFPQMSRQEINESSGD